MDNIKIYQGSPLFLFTRLKQNYKNVWGSTKGLITFNEFKKEMDTYKEIVFNGCYYRLNPAYEKVF